MSSQCRLAACAVLFTLGLSGCHHHHAVVYAPPPPPTPRPATTATARNIPLPTYPRPSDSQAPVIIQQPAPVERGHVLSTETGTASWYGPPYNHRAAADGSIYDQNAMTAAHRTLPLGTLVRVTNVATGQSANVRITDRGPFVPGRIIDLSLAAAKATGLYRMGVGTVKVDVYQLPPNADPEGRWCVQVGAFAHESDAVKLKDALARRYATAKVIEFAGPTGHWVRITAARQDRASSAQVAANIHPVDPAAVPYLVRTN